jgi:hypothetical protein
MKKTFYLFGLFLLVSGCATLVPPASSYKTDVPDADRKYQFDMQSVDLSKVPDEEKNAAKKLLFEYHSFRVSLEKLIVGNDSILTRNNKLNNTYSTTSGIVGGLGGLTAIGSVVASWTVIVPIATGVWNLIGLGIQKINIAPELEKGNSLKDQYISLNKKFTNSRDFFNLFVTSKTVDEAKKYYTQWDKELNSVLNETESILGIPRIK